MLQQQVERLFEHKLILVTGKGGIGKTVVATAMAMAAAQQGKRVCLVECADEDQIAPLLGHKSVGHSLTRHNDNLYFINLDQRLNFRDFVVKHLGFEQLFERVFNQAVIKSFVEMIPGLAEITLLGRLYYSAELARDPQFDLVIFDGFASGHFLSLMRTPDVILSSGLVGPIVRETQKVKDFLTSAHCATIMVGAPEALVLSEVQDFVPTLLAQSPVALKGLFINRVPGTSDDLEVLAAKAASDPIACQLAALVKNAQEQLASLTDLKTDLQKQPADKNGDFIYAELPEVGWIDEPLTMPLVQHLLALAAKSGRA